MKSQGPEIDSQSSPIALKFHRWYSSTAADSSVKLQSDRGIFDIIIAASILHEIRCQLSPNRYRSAGRNGKMAPGPILRIRRGHPPPHRHRTAIVEIYNMKTLKPQNPLRPAATAPHKWKRSHMVLEPFSVPHCGAAAVWRQLTSNLLKYRSRDTDIKNTPIALKSGWRICCRAADLSVKFQIDW